MLFEQIVLWPNDFEISSPLKGARENTSYTVQVQYFNDAATVDNGDKSNLIKIKRTITCNMTLRNK